MNTFKRIANLWDSVRPVVTAHSVDTFKAALDYVAIKYNNCQSVLYNKLTSLLLLLLLIDKMFKLD